RASDFRSEKHKRILGSKNIYNMNRIVILMAATVALSVSALSGIVRGEVVSPAQNLLVLPQSTTDTSMALLWDKPESHTNVTRYEVYQNDTLVGTTAADKTFYGASNLQPD